MLSVSGIYSGLDVNRIVDTLVNAEKAPVESRLNRSNQAYQIDLSALGKLKASLETFKEKVEDLNDSQALSPRASSVSDEQVLNVEVSSAAAEGIYTFFVDQLASRHQLVSEPIVTGGAVGTGAASFTVNGEAFSINVAAGEESLVDLRDAINLSPDNALIQASIVNDGNQQRLMLTSLKSGEDYSIAADFSGLTGGSATLGGMVELQPAGDAIVRFGSGASAITISSPDNTLKNLVDGVTLELKSISPDPQTLQVTLDKDAVESSLQGFVDSWNSLKSTFDELTDFNGETAGPLNGDAQARVLENQLRRSFSSLFGAPGDSFRTLGDIGLKTTQLGDLTLDTVRLREALENNFDGLASVINGDVGLIDKLSNVFDSYLGTGGSIASRESRINEALNEIKNERADLDLRLERIRKYYQDQFLAMENLLASLSNTSQWLTNNLNAGNPS